MGRVYLFTCERCEYQARVSGGADEGYHCITQTVTCHDCKMLQDAVVRMRVPEDPPRLKRLLPAPVDARDVLLFGQPPRTKWTDLKLACPVAAHHRVERWNAPGKCPRCGNYLERGALPFRVWD